MKNIYIGSLFFLLYISSYSFADNNFRDLITTDTAITTTESIQTQIHTDNQDPLTLLSLLYTIPTQSVCKEGISLTSQDLSNIPLGNMFTPQDGADQDIASINCNNLLKLAIIRISIKNDTNQTYILDENLINSYIEYNYDLLLNYLSEQDYKQYFYNRRKIHGFILTPSFFLFSIGALREYINNSYISGVIPLTSSLITVFLSASTAYFTYQAKKRSDFLIESRKKWIKTYQLEKKSLLLPPQSTVTKVILLNRDIYKNNGFTLSVIEDKKGFDPLLKKIVTFYIPFNKQTPTIQQQIVVNKD